MQAFRWFGLAVGAGALACVLPLLSSCGSGAVTDPSQTPPAAVLAVTPASATLYPGLVTTFAISGGSGTYSVISDNQAVVPNVPSVGSVFSVMPATVAAQTKVNLTVSDGQSSTKVPLTVEPITIAPIGAQPATIAFQGVAAGTCSSGVAAEVIVFGGHPPYVVSQPGAFIVNPSVITGNPARLTITSTGQCAPATAIAIVDAAGASTTVTATNTLSSATVPPAAPFSVAPLAVTLTSCKDIANIALVGGTGHYFAASGNSFIYANINGPNTGFITRQSNTGPPPTSVQVAFSDGITIVPVTVTLSFLALQPC